MLSAARAEKAVKKGEPVLPRHPAARTERSLVSAPWTESGSLMGGTELWQHEAGDGWVLLRCFSAFETCLST